MTYPERKCSVCGVTFMPTGASQKYCKICKKEVTKEKNRQYALQKQREDPDYYRRKHEEFKARQKKENKPKKADLEKIKLCNEKVCRTCKYSNKHASTVTCDYLIITGHRRGCPAGACDKYEKGQRKTCGLDLTKHTG